MKGAGGREMSKVIGKPIEFIKRNPISIAVFLVFVLYFVSRTVHLGGSCIVSDESHYIRWAQMALDGNPWYSLLFDGKPPLHPWAIAPFLLVFKDPLIAGRMTSVFFGALTTLGLLLLGKEMRDLKLGTLAAFLYVVCPYSLAFDRLAETEGMLLALFVFAIYFAVKAAKEMKLLYLIGTAACTGLALLTKGTAQLLYPIVPFAYLVRKPGRRKGEGKRPLVRWLVGVTLSLLLGFGMSCLLRLAPAFQQRSDIVSGRTKSLGEAFRTIGDLPKFLYSILVTMLELVTPALFIMCVAGLLLGLLMRWKPSYFLWAWLVIGCAVISFLSRNYWARFYLVLLPPVLLGGAYAIYEFYIWVARALRERRGRSWRMLFALFSVVLAAGIVLFVVLPIGNRARDIYKFRLVPGGNNIAVGTGRIVDCLEEGSDGRVVVFAASRDPGFLKRCLDMYMEDEPGIEIVDLPHPLPPGPIPAARCCGLSEILDANREEIEEAIAGGRVYLVADSVRLEARGTGWEIEVVGEYPYPEVKELEEGDSDVQPGQSCFTFFVKFADGRAPE